MQCILSKLLKKKKPEYFHQVLNGDQLFRTTMFVGYISVDLQDTVFD